MEHDDYIAIIILRFGILFGFGVITWWILLDVLSFGSIRLLLIATVDNYFEYVMVYTIPICGFLAFILYASGLNRYALVKKKAAFVLGIMVFFLNDVISFMGSMCKAQFLRPAIMVLLGMPLMFTFILLAQGRYLKSKSKKEELNGE